MLALARLVAMSSSITLSAVIFAGALAALGACRERAAGADAVPPVVSAGQLADACAGDSLRPAAGAPAQGLWLYEASDKRVAAMIGPPHADDRALVVTHPVESMEISASGDTLRHRHDAATVSLELLPSLGALGGSGEANSTVNPHPVATYAVSPRVRLAAYEPCATSRRGPRIRYIRRDSAGRIVTDVMLIRASEQ
ncbi:MAG: hypothetical protein K0S86_4261 [Geminicoccaceae bacterium]|jgi:hypothetical protein|nr:hypothetical protein [Geminicoccaceae bacterium]